MIRRVLAGIALALGLLAALAGTPNPPRVDVEKLAGEVAREEDHVTALELAQWIKDRKAGLRVIDVGPGLQSGRARLPGAERIALETLVKTPFRGDETVVLVSEGGGHAAQGWVLLRLRGLRQVYFLRGGVGEWNDEVANAKQSTPLTRYFRRGGC